jgi:signal transduction histidine kinase
MIEDAITTVQPAARKKSIAIIARQPSRTTPLLGDESLLLQAMINLLDNAVKFSPEHTTVTVEMEEQPQQFVLRVIDRGPGIVREERQRIFDKFQRGNQTAKADGFGLGLHLVQQIVDRHHGSIAVLDGDEGAVFQIILPKLDQAVGETGTFPCA